VPAAKELIMESPFTSMVENFPTFPNGNWFFDLWRKSKLPLKLINKYQQFNAKGRTFD
jgi:hypothetical protein